MTGIRGIRFRSSRVLLVAAGIGFAAAVTVLLVNGVVIVGTARYIADPRASAVTAYVAIVPGAQVLSRGRLSAMLEDRVRTAVELYHNGRVRKLLLTGDHRERTYNEVDTMRRRVLELGVQPRDIFVDRRGLNTFQSMQRALSLIHI